MGAAQVAAGRPNMYAGVPGDRPTHMVAAQNSGP
jgi:hypothetical protein